MQTRRDNILRWSVTVCRAALLLIGTSAASPSLAYRPFDGTDAAVADKGELEVELQPAGVLGEGSQTRLVAPAAVLNYGFSKGWEAVLQGQAETPLSSSEPASLRVNEALLKYVIREGALQDKSGPSIATEFGFLLPGINAEPGLGVSWAGIISQRWDWGTTHLNVAASLDRDQHFELFLDGIVEGPHSWKVRPVAEVFYDDEFGKERTISGLVGAIWQVRDTLSFDIGVRRAVTGDRPVTELRAGMTIGFPNVLNSVLSHR